MAAKVMIITQARMGSTRLPGKILQVVGEKTLLEYHLERLSQTGYPIVVATTNQSSEEPLIDSLEKNGFHYYRGSEDDVLDRFYKAVQNYPAEILVRVTSDCPLIDPDIIVEAVEQYKALKDDQVYLSNCLQRTYPRGFDFEIFSAQMLNTAAKNAKDKIDREHVTPYFYRHSELPFKHVHFKTSKDFSSYRLTVDEPADLALMKELIEKYEVQDMGWSEIVEVLESHPELARINQHVEQKKLGGVSFRRAQTSDSKKLFDWRNDPVTRANSISTDPVSWPRHEEWFAKSLVDSKREIWLAIFNNQDVGMIRLDRGQDVTELSWSVAPEHRGRGLGSQILATFVSEHPAAYVAKVKKQNLASLKMAEKAGFKIFKEDDDLALLKN